MDLVWEGTVRAARPLIAAGSVLNVRARRAVQGRRDAIPRFERFAAARNREAPLIWVHAPSVGESLMAQAIIAELRARRPLDIAFTFFSPSAERVADSVGADVHAWLPWDTRRDVNRALDALRPHAVVFVRTDVWPVLVHEADRRGVKVMLVNAPLAQGSSRLRPLARAFLRPYYARLAAVAAVAEEDAACFAELGVAQNRVHVAGDARFDQVWHRVQQMAEDDALVRRFRDPSVPTLVAGSTWPEDEDRLIPAFGALRTAMRLRTIIAPHEPTRAHVTRTLRLLAQFGIMGATLSEMERSGDPAEALPPAMVVDRVGVLARLYAAGQLAYVGGGFGRRGLHSVIEPAALGLPVLFGPHPGNAREAVRLAEAGGGAVISDAATLAREIRRLLEDADAGRRARAFVERNVGAAARIADLILTTMDARPSFRTAGNQTKTEVER